VFAVVGKLTGLETGHYEQRKAGTELPHSMRGVLMAGEHRCIFASIVGPPGKNPVKDEVEERR
jgi:hypothetical protein